MLNLIGGSLGSVLWIIGLICAIWVIYDTWTANRRLAIVLKIIWTVLAIAFSWGGTVIVALIYYLIYKK